MQRRADVRITKIDGVLRNRRVLLEFKLAVHVAERVGFSERPDHSARILDGAHDIVLLAAPTT